MILYTKSFQLVLLSRMRLWLVVLVAAAPCLGEAGLSRELEECRGQLADQGFLSSICSTASSYLSRDGGLRASLARALDTLDLAGAEGGAERELNLALTAEDLALLQGFVRGEQGSPAEVAAVLARSVEVRGRWLELPTVFAPAGLHLQASMVMLLQSAVVFCCVLVPLVLGWSRWGVAVTAVCLAVLHTWVHLYHRAAARKQAALARHATAATTGCLLERQGWAAAARDFFSGLFNGVTDPCEEYYTAALVDPAWEVSLLDAVAETAAACLVAPARALGQAAAAFYSHLLLPLPLVWKAPILLLATLLLLILLLLLCGYEFSVPFLLSIRPGKRRRSEERVQLASSSPSSPLPYPTFPNQLDHLVDPDTRGEGESPWRRPVL